jgi:hypothetical protein
VRAAGVVIVLGALVSPVAAAEVPSGAGVQVGDVCTGPLDPAPRPGLLCRPAFVEIQGTLQEEWEFEVGNVLNGRRGDSVLSAGCGLVAKLLKEVNPDQTYSHSGIMVEDRYKIRHSTASEDRMFDNAGTDGVVEEVLKFGWPGTITQTTDEAFEGAILTSPEGKGYHLASFNMRSLDCPDGSGALPPDTILKPPPLVELDPETNARAKLEFAAAAASGIEGHYRFFGYSQPNEILFTPVDTNNWADGTVGSVCSALIWRSMKDIGFTLEGTQLEQGDAAWGGALGNGQGPDGLYLYTETERNDAAEFLYNTIFDSVYEVAGGAGDVIVDAPDDAGNQIVNCFGFDWCGETFSTYAAQHGCDSGDGSAQDSPCWLNEGAGFGWAVSPDNMVAWDAAPDGPYGYREDLVYQPGDYRRVFRWGPASGTATLEGTVTDGGSASASTAVSVTGLQADTFTDASGAYRIEAVPEGPWTVRACSADTRGAAAIVDMPNAGALTQDLALQAGCNVVPHPGKWKRRVRVFGTIKVTDTEDFGSDEVDTFTVDEYVDVEPNTEANPDAAGKILLDWQRCTGDEVLARFRIDVDLDQNNRSVKLAYDSRMFEGESCNNDDLDDTTNGTLTVVEDGSKSLSYVMDNEEWGGEDTIQVNLTVENEVAPPPN